MYEIASAPSGQMCDYTTLSILESELCSWVTLRSMAPGILLVVEYDTIDGIDNFARTYILF